MTSLCPDGKRSRCTLLYPGCPASAEQVFLLAAAALVLAHFHLTVLFGGSKRVYQGTANRTQSTFTFPVTRYSNLQRSPDVYVFAAGQPSSTLRGLS